MTLIALVTGTSSGFGRMIARDLAGAGHTAYASMRDTAGKSADKLKENGAWAAQHGFDLRAIELEVQDEASVAAAVETNVAEQGRIDVLVQNAGHMVFGPSEAFTPDQLARLYDVNVLGAQRVARAVLPHMPAARGGLVLWISSSSVAGGVPPLLGPYFAASRHGRAGGLLRPGAGALRDRELDRRARRVHDRRQPLRHAGAPDDRATADAYTGGWPHRFADRIKDALVAPDVAPKRNARTQSAGKLPNSRNVPENWRARNDSNVRPSDS